MQDKITQAIDSLILAAVIEGGVSDEKLPASRELTNLRKSELMEAISAPCLHQIQEPAPVQAAPAAVAVPENVREGAPYDNPAFEKLARELGVWGTAQSAVCAQFWLAETPATVNQQLTIERKAFEQWLGIKPCGAAHDFGWEAWKARAALAVTPADKELKK